jgi:hypothetical protein
VYPTSEFLAAALSPRAFTVYVVAVLLFIALWLLAFAIDWFGKL